MSKKTLEQIKDELKELLEVAETAIDDPDTEGLKYVVVRTYSAGVHVGFLERLDETTQTVELVKARRIRNWEGAFTLSELAINGLDSNRSRLSIEIPRIILLEAIEIIPTSSRVQTQLRGVKSYEPT